MKRFSFTILSIILFTSSLAFSTEDVSQDIKNLENISKGFTYVGEKAIPAVVFIKAEFNYQGQQDFQNFDNPFDPFGGDDFFRKFFGQAPRRDQRRAPTTQIAGGSGAIVSPDGYIVTNNHIVQDSNKITVILNSGEEYQATVIGTDPKTDLAVLKIQENDLPYLEFGNSDNLQIGEWAIAIGSPFELQSTLTVGVISAKGRENVKISDLGDFIQTDAAINPGNSGGPLLNLKGQIIGINVAILTQTGGYMGIGFAIPSKTAKVIMDQLISKGSVDRGYLGIYLQEMDKEMAEALNLDKTEGVLISQVPEGTAADKAGIKQGDVIIAYNDKPIKSLRSFRNEIAMMTPGDSVKLKVLRNGKTKEITVKLGSSDESTVNTQTSQKLGIDVSELKDMDTETLKKYGYTPDTQGVLITSVKSGSIAEKVGLKPGVLILQINQQRIHNIADFNEALKDVDSRKSILLLIKYGNITRFISLKLK